MSAEYRQAAFTAEVSARRAGLSYRIVTFGCQMNQHDALRLMGWCDGFGWVDCEDDPDAIIFITCCVREGAERRVHGQVAALRAWREAKPERILVVCGCMMQQEGVAKAFAKRHAHVDLVMGTHALERFPELVARAAAGERVVEAAEGADTPEGVPVRMDSSTTAYVAIAYGCDNYCSYCIVPSVRGRERSRAPDDILREAEGLAASGVREIMLLGQNVNSYAGAPEGFPGLLRRVRALGFARIRFMTSHPKDISDELIGVMAEGRGVCAQLHLPMQSGSDRILHAMNRGYTAGHYLDLTEKLRAAMPDIGITTDVIVGFPGETQEDFSATLELMRAARPDGAYTFLFSPRKGTPAAEMPGRVGREEMSARNTRLRAAVDEIAGEALRAHLGMVRGVLAEERGSKDGILYGRIERGFRAGFPGSEKEIGEIAAVRIGEVRHNTLMGVREKEPSI